MLTLQNSPFTIFNEVSYKEGGFYEEIWNRSNWVRDGKISIRD